MHGCNENPSKVNEVFTQVVWKATKFFGCAKNTCTLGGQSGTLWACEYDPPGNDPNALKENVPKPINTSTHAASKPRSRRARPSFRTWISMTSREAAARRQEY